MNNTLHIIQHSGLGDHILCNGIIRTYAQRYDKVFINTVPGTDANVRFMYRDLKNVEFYDLFYVDYQKYIADNPQNNYLLIGVTGQFFGKLERGEYRSFDYGFYACAEVPYYHRWGRFHVDTPGAIKSKNRFVAGKKLLGGFINHRYYANRHHLGLPLLFK